MTDRDVVPRLHRLAGSAGIENALDAEDDIVAQRRAGSELAAAEEEVAQLKTALGRRTVIGQATGILMERYELDSENAFLVLVRLSQETNRKLYDIAAELTETGLASGLSDVAGRPRSSLS